MCYIAVCTFMGHIVNLDTTYCQHVFSASPLLSWVVLQFSLVTAILLDCYVNPIISNTRVLLYISNADRENSNDPTPLSSIFIVLSPTIYVLIQFSAFSLRQTSAKLAIILNWYGIHIFIISHQVAQVLGRRYHSRQYTTHNR